MFIFINLFGMAFVAYWVGLCRGGFCQGGGVFVCTPLYPPSPVHDLKVTAYFAFIMP